MSVSYGGQAVLEGVMMRGPSCWAVAVRTPEGGIEEVVRDVTSPMKRHRIWRLPVIRGVIALGESLAIGFRALAISANVAAREEDEDGNVVTEITRGQIIFSFAIAMQYLGVPYVWGGMSPSGFDCSGLVAYAYAQIGVSLPHHAASQYGYGAPVSRDALQPADLVFFNGLGHMGMYIGGGQFIHAPHTGDVVKISSLYDSWYASTWVGARRIL